ncbi:hypothetical protein [Amycolatopsis sp. PS_44_ISF1]|uniref:hypothetical protein n=1 Tax=Amycolatopsis sp. PS_44_ISF1 TaxID=2974917 RepID=UPI0028DFE43A|nr:hypothetical protein [Amycolatopsis sp. PS_44_ISF1]MDT8912260.1 hypothetical protein [Amycolatopsis sp. PS_44_ISF1]
MARWVGIDNDADVLTEPALQGAVLNAFGFIVFYWVIPLALGLVLAALIAATPWKAMPVIRMIPRSVTSSLHYSAVIAKSTASFKEVTTLAAFSTLSRV